jgi:hypothetical protein
VQWVRSGCAVSAQWVRAQWVRSESAATRRPGSLCADCTAARWDEGSDSGAEDARDEGERGAVEQVGEGGSLPSQAHYNGAVKQLRERRQRACLELTTDPSAGMGGADADAHARDGGG